VSFRRKVGFSVVAALMAVPVTLLLAELGLRWLNLSRVQLVDLDSEVHPYVDDGVLLFQPDNHEALAGRSCVDEDKRVAVFVGDSVMYAAKTDVGVGTGNFVFRLRERFAEEGWCFVNLSAPGYSGWQQAHLVERALRELHPDVIFWGFWKADGAWLDLGDQWVDLSAILLDVDGYPLVSWAPTGLHHRAFRGSRLWQHLAVLAAERAGGGPPGDELAIFQHVRDSVQRCVDANVPFVVVDFPSLSRSFEESALEPRYPAIRGWFSEQQVAVLDVAGELLGEDHELLRADTCCHYNEAGNRRLAEVFEREIRRLSRAPSSLRGRPDELETLGLDVRARER